MGQRIAAIVVIVLGVGAGSVSAGSVQIYGGEFNLPIPDKGWAADAVINVPEHRIISDLNVEISITHTNVFDLQIFFTGPAQTRICLNMYNFDDFFKGANYTQTIFDDQADVPIEQGVAPFTGRFRPIEPYKLSAFDGQDAFGTWRLQIYDAYYADTGTLNSFQITITNPEPSMIMLFAIGASLMVCLARRLNSGSRRETAG
jgi:subtilisin-like proprotein convertase family protein